MPFTRADYSRTRTRSVRSAIAAAVADYIRSAVFEDQLGRPVQMARVYDAWPPHTDRLVVPAACVLPSLTRYAEARLTPALIRSTWEPAGMPGFGLYKTADIEAEVQVEIRGASDAERDVVIAGMEDLWTASDTNPTDVSGFQPGSTKPRYGVQLVLPGYWGLCGGFWLISSMILDNEQEAIREHWRAICTIGVAAPAVRLGPVQPMKPVVKALFDC